MIFTNTAFIYGHYIDITNNYLPFSEGGPELLAELKTGSYTLVSFGSEISRALNEAGSLDYEVTIDIETRIITISASGNFSLLIATGTTIEIAPFNLMGFTGSDRSGDDSYSGDLASGYEYQPQYELQDFIDAEDDVEANQASVNISTDASIVETVSYGEVKIYSFNITLANDYVHEEGSPIKNNQSGVSDLRDFLKYITKKRPILFIKDISDYDAYDVILLESTQKSQKGTGYLLREMYSDGLVGYYETGLIKFRKLR